MNVRRIRIIKIIFFATALLLAMLAWSYFASLIGAVFTAVVLAYLLNLAVKPLEEYMARWKAITIVLFSITLVVVIVIFIAVPPMLNELRQFINNIDGYLEYIDNFILSFSTFAERFSFDMPFDRMKETLFGWINTFVAKIPTETIPGIIISLPTLLLTPVLTVYFVCDREYFTEKIMYLIPQRIRGAARKLGHDLNLDLGRYLRGQLLITCIHSAIGSAAFFLCGIPFSLILGIFFGICNIVPYFGPIVGTVVIAFAALPSGIGKVLLALAVTICLQQIDNALITPRIMSNVLGIHPVLVLLSVIAFGQLFSMAGLLLSVPILIFIQKLLDAFFEYRVKINFDYEQKKEGI